MTLIGVGIFLYRHRKPIHTHTDCPDCELRDMTKK
jgi:hypothetical protein